MLESLFDKVARVRLRHRCFSVKYAKGLKAPFFTEHLQWLLLIIAPFPLDINSQ